MLSKQELLNLHGKDYVEEFEKNQSEMRLERLIGSLDLQEQYKVVDFACGNGMMLPLVAERVTSYTGVDFSAEFIAAAERRKTILEISNAEYVCSDIQQFSVDNPKHFYAGFAMDFSEHVYDEEWLPLLRSMHDSLKPGGKLYLHTPNADFFLEIMKGKNFIVKQFPEHIAVRSNDHNCALLQRAGFEIGTVKMIPHYNILRFLHPLTYLPLFGRWFEARIFIEAVRPCEDGALRE